MASGFPDWGRGDSDRRGKTNGRRVEEEEEGREEEEEEVGEEATAEDGG